MGFVPSWLQRATVRTVKTPETDNRVVDHLYDDLPDAQREAFTADLDSDEAAATEARSFATILKLYREHSDELTPSVAATERLMREAERAHLSLWAKLMGDLLPRVVLRPAMGFAMVAVLLIGGGVFYLLSQRTGPSAGSDTGREAKPNVDRTVARAPASAPATGETRTVLAERGTLGGAGKRDNFKDEGLAGSDQDKEQRRPDGDSAAVAQNFRYKNKQGGLAARDRRYQAEINGLRGRQSRRAAKLKKRVAFGVGSVTRGAAAPAKPKTAAESPPPTSNQAADLRRGIDKSPVGSKAVQQKANPKKISPPALHNRARKNLAKGQIAVACRMFGSLVRGHRSYSGRADALLGWARCEMYRGSYSRAAQLARQLISEYPKWEKTGTAMLAQIQRSQTNAALRAQRVKRVRRKYAPVKARPARRRGADRSNTSSGK